MASGRIKDTIVMTDKDKENKTTDKEVSSKPAEVKMGLWTWVIMLTVIALLSSSGFVLGRLMAGSSSSDAVTTPPETETTQATPSETALPPTNQGTWYYNDLESVIVNPDEPGATRFIRVGLILEMSEELSQEKSKELIEAKKPLLINWMNLYFKGLALNEMENEKDLNRILSQICDAFNEILFPEARPQIKKILIREFNIQ